MNYHDIPLPDVQRTAPETTDSPIQMKYDVEQQGYVVEEYYISGQADIYESVTMADSMNREEQDPTKSMARRDFNRPVIKADVNYCINKPMFFLASKYFFHGDTGQLFMR